MGIHWTGPYLASQNIEDGAGMQDVVRVLKICACTGIRLSRKLSVCGDGRGVDSVLFSVLRL